MLNIGKQVKLNLVQGYLESRIVYFIMNLNTAAKNFYISRHGESMFNVFGKIGGNSDLSPQGMLFSEKLPESLLEAIPKDARMVIWTSTLKRYVTVKRPFKDLIEPSRRLSICIFLNYNGNSWMNLLVDLVMA